MLLQRDYSILQALLLQDEGLVGEQQVCILAGELGNLLSQDADLLRVCLPAVKLVGLPLEVPLHFGDLLLVELLLPLQRLLEFVQLLLVDGVEPLQLAPLGLFVLDPLLVESKLRVGVLFGRGRLRF